MLQPESAPTVTPEPVTTLERLHVEIVDGCQLRCVGCPNSTLIRKPTFISPELFAACLRNLDVERVLDMKLFLFGEPLLHPAIEELGAILRDEAPFRLDVLEISTNAQTRAEAKLEALAGMGVLNRLAISCDGDGTPARYEALRPPAKWPRLMALLGFAADLKRRYPALSVVARSIIETPDDAHRWREVLAPFGIEPDFRGWKHLPDASRNMTGRAVRVGRGVCFYADERHWLFVNHLGEVVPCCLHPRAGVFGNLADQRFSALVDGPMRQAFIARMATERPGMRVCGNCELGPKGARGPSAGRALSFEP
jgi:MoaA/NifB/PqqE/SkfB family radical SAM enzyme